MTSKDKFHYFSINRICNQEKFSLPLFNFHYQFLPIFSNFPSCINFQNFSPRFFSLSFYHSNSPCNIHSIIEPPYYFSLFRWEYEHSFSCQGSGRLSYQQAYSPHPPSHQEQRKDSPLYKRLHYSLICSHN